MTDRLLDPRLTRYFSTPVAFSEHVPAYKEPSKPRGWWGKIRYRYESFLRRIGAEVPWEPLPHERQPVVWNIAGRYYVRPQWKHQFPKVTI